MQERIVRYNGRQAQFSGTNIEVWKVIKLTNAGTNLRRISEIFPRLSVADLAAADDFYATNSAEVDEAIAAEDAQ